VLRQLVIEMYARGLSTRDIEDAFTDATGWCLLFRSAVGEPEGPAVGEMRGVQSTPSEPG